MRHPREVGMCDSRKVPYPPHGRSLEILRGWFQMKKPPMKEVWIFPGTTQQLPHILCEGIL